MAFQMPYKISLFFTHLEHKLVLKINIKIKTGDSFGIRHKAKLSFKTLQNLEVPKNRNQYN